MLNLSLRDRDRLHVLRELEEGALKLTEAARRLGLSDRHVRRLRQRFSEVGDEAVVHRGRGQPSNNRIDDRIRTRALERAAEPQFHYGTITAFQDSKPTGPPFKAIP